MKCILGLLTVLMLSACAATSPQVTKQVEREKTTAGFDALLVYNNPDKEIIELQQAYSRGNYEWMKNKVKGYFDAGSDQFVSDLIHESPGMSLRMLAVASMYNDVELFDKIYELAMVNDYQEVSKRFCVLFRRALIVDCTNGEFTQAMRSYLRTRKVADVNYKNTDRTCRETLEQIF